MDRKGKIEQVHAMNGDSTSDAKQSTPAVFGNGGRSVVFHSRESSCLVWNKMKDEVWILEIVSRLQLLLGFSLTWWLLDVDEQTQAVAVSILGFVRDLRY